MPYQVQQLIQGKGLPICVSKDDLASKALTLMIEHDFSQLPVIDRDNGYEIPLGMVTHESILRGIRNFKAKLEDLKVQHVMVSASIYSLEDDLFDILDRLKDTNAVLITEGAGPDLIGIVTNYDTSEYFRNRIEDLMRVEDIELMVRDFIKEAYSNDKKELDINKLQKSIDRVVLKAPDDKKKSFDDLTLYEYISLLLLSDTWEFFEPIFNLPKGSIKELLDGVRLTRNGLAHFRNNISPEQRDQLKFAVGWLSRCQEDYQSHKSKNEIEMLLTNTKETLPINIHPLEMTAPNQLSSSLSTAYSVTDSASGGGKYATLSDWLQSQPGKIDQVQLTFDQVEEIMGTDLPASAYNHRAWWSNDAIGHSHSQEWLDAGWRTTYVNMTEGKVTFTRIGEREKAYISFFSKLLDDLKKKVDFSVKTPSPDGASWIVIQNVPRIGASFGAFSYSFSRDKRFRVELYLDLGDQAQTKAAFDSLYAKRNTLETQTGEIVWERLDNKRASRIAMYHPGQITDERTLPELRVWGAETMAKFYKTFVDPAESVILKIKNG